MILITKAEAAYLNSKGFKYGSDLHHTYTKHKKYYATEGMELLAMLNKYRKARLVK